MNMIITGTMAIRLAAICGPYQVKYSVAKSDRPRGRVFFSGLIRKIFDNINKRYLHIYGI